MHALVISVILKKYPRIEYFLIKIHNDSLTARKRIFTFFNWKGSNSYYVFLPVESTSGLKNSIKCWDPGSVGPGIERISLVLNIFVNFRGLMIIIVTIWLFYTVVNRRRCYNIILHYSKIFSSELGPETPINGQNLKHFVFFMVNSAVFLVYYLQPSKLNKYQFKHEWCYAL